MASLQGRIKQKQLGSGTTAAPIVGFTGAAPQQVNGATQSTAGIAADCASISALVYTKATTNLLTLTVKWQGSFDGVTWYDCYSQNNASLVVQVTGTGSAVTATRLVSAPDAIYGTLYFRCAVVSGVGSGGGLGVDECYVFYNYRTVSPLTA